jgi:hypothetical protein
MLHVELVHCLEDVLREVLTLCGELAHLPVLPALAPAHVPQDHLQHRAPEQGLARHLKQIVLSAWLEHILFQRKGFGMVLNDRAQSGS